MAFVSNPRVKQTPLVRHPVFIWDTFCISVRGAYWTDALNTGSSILKQSLLHASFRQSCLKPWLLEGDADGSQKHRRTIA